MKKLFTLWLALLSGLITNAQTKFVKSVPTLTELRALNVADIHTNVLVNSYWTSNTNSVGALFQWVPGATDATNTTSVFAPASGTGRWIRVELPANPGSATQPGFRFLGDDNTGIYNSGADAIDFSTGGSRRWGITSAGILQSQGAQTISSSSSTLTLQPVGSLIVSPNSSEAMRVLTTGAVGIGTTGPDKKLDVLDASNAQLRLSQADGTVYTDIGTISTGHTLITNSYGTRITSTTVNDTSVLARQVQGGLAFDGVTTTANDAHTIGADIGTSACSFRFTMLVPTANLSAIGGIFFVGNSKTSIDTSGGFMCYIPASFDGIRIYARQSADASTASCYVAGVISAYGGKIVDVVIVRPTSGSVQVYINGVAQTLTSESFTGAGSWQQSITSTYLVVGNFGSTNPFNSTIFSATLFNRALSASEVITLANQGVQEADKWGSLTATYTSDFSAGVNGWATGANLSALAQDAGPVGGANWLKLTCNTTSGIHWAYRYLTPTYGKKYLLTFTYYIPSSNSDCNQVAIWNSNGTLLGGPYTTLDAATTVSLPITADSYQLIRFPMYKNGSSTFQDLGGGDVVYIRGITITQIGSILDADLSAGVGYQVPDRSSNKYHGVVSATGTSWTLANRRGQIRYTTTGATTGAFQLLSGTAIPSNALIQSIVAWSAGTPLVYVGTATGTSNIVGHTTLVGSTYTPLTLSSQFSTTGNLWLNKSATNEVNLTVNYMIADP